MGAYTNLTHNQRQQRSPLTLRRWCLEPLAMERMMILTEAQIEELLAQNSITDEWPWSTNDEKTIDGHIKNIVAKVRLDVGLLDKSRKKNGTGCFLRENKCHALHAD
jgi:hypothetical protein